MRQQNPASRGFYLAMSLWMAVIIVVGFWPTYFGPLLAGTLDLRPILEIHAVIFTGWMVLLVAQASLAYTRRLGWHRKLGRLVAGYAALMVVVALVATFAEFSARIAAGEIRSAHRFLLIPLVDLLLFGGFLAAAIVYRNKPQIHKRLIIVATVVLLGPAVGRMTFLTSFPQIIAIMFSPLLLGMAFDVATRRRVHAVYVIGLIVYLASFARIPLRESEAWIGFSKWAYGLFT